MLIEIWIKELYSCKHFQKRQAGSTLSSGFSYLMSGEKLTDTENT